MLVVLTEDAVLAIILAALSSIRSEQNVALLTLSECFVLHLIYYFLSLPEKKKDCIG